MERITSLMTRKNPSPFKYRELRRFLHIGQHFTRGSLNEIELTTPVPLAGRKYLPSSQAQGFPQFLSGPTENYPLLVKALNGQEATLELWAKRSKEIIQNAYLKYEKDGSPVAILFRGLPVCNEQDFSVWVNGLSFEPFPYSGSLGVISRDVISRNVTKGSREAKEITIEPHSEMAYSARYPKIFTMASFKTARYGGETAICDVREVSAKLDPDFVKKCETKMIRYTYFFHDNETRREVNNLYQQSWQQKFLTDDRTEVEIQLKENDYGYEWDGSGLYCWKDLQPFIFHPRSGERLWFNYVAGHHYSFLASNPQFEGVQLPAKQYPFSTTYGDGEEIEQTLIDEHRRITWENAVGFKWQDGDILFLDQLVVQHSRLGFEGDRKVGVSLLTY